MAIVLDEKITEKDFSSNRRNFFSIKVPTLDDKFRSAYCLVKCKDKLRIQRALSLFENILDQVDANDLFERDIMYYMTVGYTKIHEYEQALYYLKQIYLMKTNNSQVDELYAEVNRRVKKDGLIGIGITVGTGAGLVIGASVYVGVKVLTSIVKLIKP
jgi:fission 1 protein